MIAGCHACLVYIHDCWYVVCGRVVCWLGGVFFLDEASKGFGMSALHSYGLSKDFPERRRMMSVSLHAFATAVEDPLIFVCALRKKDKYLTVPKSAPI